MLHVTYHAPSLGHDPSGSLSHVRLSWSSACRRARLVTVDLVEPALAPPRGRLVHSRMDLAHGHAYATYRDISALDAAAALDGITPEGLRGLRLRAQPWGGTVDGSSSPASGASQAEDASAVAGTAAPAHLRRYTAQPLPAAEEDLSAGTPAVEARYVHALYDTIAEHFSHTRHSPWPRVEAFLGTLGVGAVVVDVGCGNGKYMRREGVAAVGCDRSAALAGICGSRGLNALVANALAVPLRSGCGDAVLSVAVLHHLSTAARRARACGELMRLARRGGGRLFVQAWAAEQGADSRRDFSAGRDALVPWCLSRRFFPAASEASVAAAGGLLDEARGAVVFHRYVHAFCAGELEGLLVEAATQGLGAGFDDARPHITGGEEARLPCAAPSLPEEGYVRLLASWWDRDNWCVVAERCDAGPDGRLPPYVEEGWEGPEKGA